MDRFDVIVVGGGHAGAEAAFAVHRMGFSCALVTFNKETKKASLNTNNPLAFSKGKLKIIKNLNLKNDIIVIGDGYTDYEIKKYGLAKYFIAYTNHVSRDNVIKNADIECDNFNKVINFLNSNYWSSAFGGNFSW